MNSFLYKPVVFLAFSNKDDAYLDGLKREVRKINQHLRPLQAKNRLELVQSNSIDVDELSVIAQEYKNRIAIFHFGGHAGDNKLIFNNGGTNSKSLAELLNTHQLKLVVLNGCATRSQVDDFLDNGVRAVIATSVAINDTKAVMFASKFYEFLSSNHSIKQSFNKAISYLNANRNKEIESEVLSYRNLKLKTKITNDTIPWGLYYRDEQILKWKLPKRSISSIYYILLSGIIFFLLTVMGWNALKNSYQPFDLTVNVHGGYGLNDYILQEQGKVIITKDDKEAIGEIGERGIVKFNDLGYEFLGHGAKLEIEHGQPYEVVHPDSIYDIHRDGVIHLEVKLLNQSFIKGEIREFIPPHNPIKDVTISLNEKVEVLTNEHGLFRLPIPQQYQKKKQIISIAKTGYKTETEIVHPHTGQLVERFIKKTNNK